MQKCRGTACVAVPRYKAAGAACIGVSLRNAGHIRRRDTGGEPRSNAEEWRMPAEKTDFDYMQEAIALAREAAAAGEIPVGALVTDRETGEILGRGRNRREQDGSPTAHAEILALEAAAKKRGTWRLSGCNLYVTLEPCPMCAGAILNAQIDRVIFGAYDPRAGAVCSVTELFSLPFIRRPRVTAGLLEDPCSALLTGFFRSLREEEPAAPPERKI